mgnify:CR=1 FL=1
MSDSASPRRGGEIRRRLSAYARLMRLHRPVGSYLLLWPTLWALWVAGEGRPDVGTVAVFVAGVIVMRAAGCVINDFADRDFDGHVERTRDRPLASGDLGPREALTLFVILLVVAAQLLVFLNRLTVALAFVGAALATAYPFMKRHTYLPQVVLGLAFGWAIPMAFAALTEALPPTAFLMYIATVLLTVVYDTEYAMVDREDDLAIGVKSTAILFGDLDRIAIAILQALCIIALIATGLRAELGWPYYLGIAAAAALFVFQQRLIRDRARADCFRAFLNNSWVGFAVFVGIVLSYLVPG